MTMKGEIVLQLLEIEEELEIELEWKPSMDLHPVLMKLAESDPENGHLFYDLMSRLEQPHQVYL